MSQGVSQSVYPHIYPGTKTTSDFEFWRHFFKNNDIFCTFSPTNNIKYLIFPMKNGMCMHVPLPLWSPGWLPQSCLCCESWRTTPAHLRPTKTWWTSRMKQECLVTWKVSRCHTSKLKLKLTISIITSKHPLNFKICGHLQYTSKCCYVAVASNQKFRNPWKKGTVNTNYSHHLGLFPTPHRSAATETGPNSSQLPWWKKMENDQLDVPELPGPWRRRSCCFPWESHR